MVSNSLKTESSYDVFLSYNSAEHSVVEDVARKLVDEGLKPFLDRWNLAPGMRWRSELEKTLGSCKAVAIFVGRGEMGSWQQREVDVALDIQSRNPSLPVIPVLLPGCEPPLGFLRQLTWVDLRTQTHDVGITILAKAARGEAPGAILQKHLDDVRVSICPYRGLLHFREEDAPFFFGRETAIEKLVYAVQRQPFVAVVGASGSGKSSAVRAGLVPRLRSDRRTAWETVILVPTDQPLKALASALLPLLESTIGEVDRLAEATKLAEHFRSGTISLDDIAKRIREKQSGIDRVLIVVDQFEELYTLSSDDQARRRFLDELLAASSRAGSTTNVAVTLRGDFVGNALAYRPLSDRLQDAQINLGPMTREELESAIRKPAEKIQLEFEPGLVRRILNDVGDEPGNLPLLEFVLKELWDKRRARVLLNETYDAIGGLQGAVATKADELLGGLSSPEQKILQRVFLRIVRPSESGMDTRRRAAFTELPAEGAELVAKLAKERLLVTNRSASGLEQTVEVAHEALISNWSTLRAWVNEDREFLLWRERLETLLAEWERAKESDEALLRGPLLIEAQKWFDQRSQDLSDQERKFISASRALRERLRREEGERQEREIQAALKLAETERQRAEVERKARRRQHSLIAALAGLLVVAGLVAGIAIWLGISARTAEEKTREAASQVNLSIARYFKRAGNDAHALAHLAQALRLQPGNHGAAALTYAMLTQNSWPLPVADPLRHAGPVRSAQFSPDGQRVVTASEDTTARLWDAATGKPLGEPMKHQDEVVSAQFSPDGRRVVTASRDRTARLWDAFTGKPLGEPMKHEAEVVSAQFSPDSQRVVTASLDRTARLWDALTGKPLGEPMKHEGSVNCAQFSSDGQRVVTASEDRTARLWDAATGKPLGEPMLHEEEVISADFSPDGQRVVTTSYDWTAQLWDTATGKPLGEPMQHEEEIISARFSPDGERLVTASDDWTARLWDAETGKPLGEPMKHQGSVYGAQFSPDGRRVVTCSRDRTARLWNEATGKPIAEPMKHGGWVNSAQFSPDGRRIVTASQDGTARLWNAISGKQIGRPMLHKGEVDFAQFSPDGQIVVTTSWDNTARLWDGTTGKPLGEPMQHEGAVSSAQFSPDGEWVVTASFDRTARLWGAATGKPLGQPMTHEGTVYSALFSPDGRRIVTASEDRTARIWDAATGKPLGEPMKHQGLVNDAEFSPDGKRVVTASADRTARLWDAATGKPLGEPMKHEGSVYSAQFSPDGRLIATASRDRTARLWDAATCKPIGEPMPHEGSVYSAVFSLDGQRVVTASQDRTARLWNAATGKPLGDPMQHEGAVYSAQFSQDSLRLVTASADHTAQLWDIPTISNAESAESVEDVLLLADLAEATGGVALQTSGQEESSIVLNSEQVRQTRREIAAKFASASSKLTPMQRFLKWSVSESTSRTISPWSELTVVEWVENKIDEGRLDGLRSAMHIDPANARLTARFGLRLAAYALEKGTDPDQARQARAEADFETRRALKLVPDNDEIKKLRAVVVKLLQMTAG